MAKIQDPKILNYIEFRYEDGRKMFSDLYVIPRKRSYRLYSGKENELLVKVMNDTFSAEPVVFEWSYEVGGRKVAGGKKTLTIEPGHGVEQVLVIDAPRVKKRTEGTLAVEVRQAGSEDYAAAMKSKKISANNFSRTKKCEEHCC